MPLYHITLHAYRSWSPDHPRGYTRRGKGYQPPDPEQARKYGERAKQDPAKFIEEVQRILIRGAYDFCQRRKMRFHGVGNEIGHVHYAISWHGYADVEEVTRRFKNLLSLMLNRALNTPGKRWFVRGESKRRVSNRSHLGRLVDKYFPDHPGLFWREGLPLP